VHQLRGFDNDPLAIGQLRQREPNTQRRAPRVPEHVSSSYAGFAATLESIGRHHEHMLEVLVLRRPAAGMVETDRGVDTVNLHLESLSGCEGSPADGGVMRGAAVLAEVRSGARVLGPAVAPFGTPSVVLWKGGVEPMTTVFLSYSRKNQVQAGALADDVKALGHQVWMDQELSGGQVWWAKILERVRDCDVFLCTLARESLESEACRRELAYAVVLEKPILPAMIADGVSPHLLPPQLASLQIIDYRASDRTPVLQLARALGALPAAPPLPDPLPAPPAAPLSYLGTLTERIDSEQQLDFQAQSGVLVDLKRALRDPECAADGLTVLARFRRRRDLLAWIAEELDDLVRSAPKAQPPPESEPREALPPSDPESRREAPFAPRIPPAPRAYSAGSAPPAKRDPLGRGKAAIVGFCVGSVLASSRVKTPFLVGDRSRHSPKSQQPDSGR
jgi:hypothetical protein